MENRKDLEYEDIDVRLDGIIISPYFEYVLAVFVSFTLVLLYAIFRVPLLLLLISYIS
jgi:hypothetical protein